MKTLVEIKQIREEKRKELDLRVNLKANTTEKHILVCRGTGCTSSKSPKIIENFRKIIEEKGIENVRVIQTGCFGLCEKGPVVVVFPEEVFYGHMTVNDVDIIRASWGRPPLKWPDGVLFDSFLATTNQVSIDVEFSTGLETVIFKPAESENL